ncbi:MAG: ATP-binding protein, partial [Verrucomicrobiota bacterium]
MIPRIFLITDEPEESLRLQASLIDQGFRVPYIHVLGPKADHLSPDLFAQDFDITLIFLRESEAFHLLHPRQLPPIPRVLLSSFHDAQLPPTWLLSARLQRPVRSVDLATTLRQHLNQRMEPAGEHPAPGSTTLQISITSNPCGYIQKIHGCSAPLVGTLQPGGPIPEILRLLPEGPIWPPLPPIAPEGPALSGSAQDITGCRHLVLEAWEPSLRHDLWVLVDSSGIIRALGRDAATTFFHAPTTDCLGRPLADLLPSWPHRAPGEAIFQTVPRDGAATQSPSLFLAVLLGSSPSSHLLSFHPFDALHRNLSEEEKIKGLSHLARGFSHDFNNLLTVLMGNIALAKAQTSSEDARRQLTEAEAATRKAQNLVQQIAIFARGSKPIKGRIPLGPLLKQLLAERPSRGRIRYHLDLQGPEWTVQADPKQLRLLVENLLRNAEQAIPDQGEIHLIVSPLTEQETGPFLQLEVRDNGSGMSSDTQERALEPFFTSRADQNATGLGLTVAQFIAQAHGGDLSFASPAKGPRGDSAAPGASVFLRLPLTKPASPASPAADRAASQTADSPLPEAGRILVLEDEHPIRRLICSTLAKKGYEVDEAIHGQEAIDHYRTALTKGSPYDLLIVDLTIENGMGGVEAMSHLRKLDPNVLALVSSGY